MSVVSFGLLPSIALGAGLSDHVDRKIRAKIPHNSRQVILVAGELKSSLDSNRVGLRRRSSNTVSLWKKKNGRWHLVQSGIKGRNGRNGWKPIAPTREHLLADIHKHPKHTDRVYRTVDDLASPIGVFSLTNAGGRLANPGTQLPWVTDTVVFDQTGQEQPFNSDGSWAKKGKGKPLDKTFNYVIGINYNRDRSRGMPLSSQKYLKPLGAAAGGDVWLHVAYGAPTHGCLVVKEKHIVKILHWIDPKQRPVIIMGDKKSLRKKSSLKKNSRQALMKRHRFAGSDLDDAAVGRYLPLHFGRIT